MTTEPMATECCERCGANPEGAPSLNGWYIDSIINVDGVAVPQVRCPECW